jgi:hypothetical protein
MPLDTSKIPEELVEAARQHTLVPLVGAGVSRQTGHPFPTWRELLDSLIHRALINKPLPSISKAEGKEMRRLLDRGQFLMVAEDLRSKLGVHDYEAFLTKTFDPENVKPAEIHKALFRLNPPLILTTNYDRLLENAHAEVRRNTADIYTYLQAANVQRALGKGSPKDRSIIFKVHGSIDDPSKIIFTELDYRTLTYEQLGYRAMISAIFITKSVLMLGFSFSDRELLLLLEALSHSFNYRSSPDYILLSAKEVGAVEIRRLKADYGVEVITYTKYSELPELINFLAAESKRKKSTSKSTAKKSKKLKKPKR